jgi:hypothetical protein
MLKRGTRRDYAKGIETMLRDKGLGDRGLPRDRRSYTIKETGSYAKGIETVSGTEETILGRQRVTYKDRRDFAMLGAEGYTCKEAGATLRG